MTTAAVRNLQVLGAQRLRRVPATPLSLRAWLYWLVVVAPAATGVYLALAAAHGGEWRRFALLTGMASAAQLTSFQLTRRRVFHPAILFIVAGALLLPPELVILLCVLHCVPDWIKQRYPWYIQTFNIANYVVSGVAACGAARLLGDFPAAGTHEAAAGAAAAVAFVAVNRLLLLPMLWLGRGLRPRETGLLAGDDAALELVLAVMAVTLAVLWESSIWLAALALAPLFVIHFTQRAVLRLEVASETIGRQNESLEEANRVVRQRSTAALEALSATVDARDKYTAGHSKRVAAVSTAIAAELGLEGADFETVSQAALLHDIGKIGVPDAVLLKEGALTQGDWLVMRSHPEEGARIIERLGYLDDVVPAIRHHHERPDGRGYPAGLIGDEIPLAARIIHVADALDAMTTERVYRAALTLDEAVAEIRRGRGTDFCSSCVDALELVLERGGLGVATSPRAAA
ncbi:MAG TPA: HD-GYP domain-containing protein [Gaiellaceae bacterium]|nr:HD-GYP domain-containing protein [Gaiellaceae bacterium]